MKKKISLLLLVFVLAATCLAGCGGSTEKATLNYDEATLQSYSENIVQSFLQMSDDNFELLKEESEFASNSRLLQAGLPIQCEDFRTMIEAWQNATKEYGAYVEHGDWQIEATDKDVTLTTTADFENKQTELAFVFDEKLNMTSLTVDVHYTIGQILEKAGLNTLLGMGTVFAVLIFISLIISLFKFIPAIEAKFKNKNKVEVAAQAPVSRPAPVQTAVVTDDTELIAVITAAIAASEGTSADGFIVRSIKRRKTNKWN